VQVYWRSELQEDDTFCCSVAPVLQELFGGENDSKPLWAGFHFHLSGLFHEAGILMHDCRAESRCGDDSPTPFLELKGEYCGQLFVIRIYLEPLPDSDTREIVDLLRNAVRPINDTDTDDGE